VGEGPRIADGLDRAPAVTSRPYRKGGKSRPAQGSLGWFRAVPLAMSLKDHLLSSPLLAQPWQTYHVKDSDKGPMVWEAKRVTITLKDANDLPGLSLELVAARDVRDRRRSSTS